MRASFVVITVLIAAAAAPASGAAQSVAGPPNTPAVARVVDGRATLTYDGRVIFSATIASTGPRAEVRTLVDTAGGAVTQVLKWTVRGGARLTLAGTVHAGPQAFACATEPGPNELAMVRNSVGPERQSSEPRRLRPRIGLGPVGG